MKLDLSDSVTIYRGDCLDILPTLGKVDAVVTDPPYGIDYGKAGCFNAGHGWGPWREHVKWDTERPSREIFDAILALQMPCVIWGGNYFTDYLPPRMGWIAWDKGQRNFSLADFELAWTSEQRAARCIIYARGKAIRDGKVHPTQKPVSVIRQGLDYLRLPEKMVVLDPFCGSGTTGIACIRTGRKFVGIEIDETYFEVARKRLEAELRQGRLF